MGEEGERQRARGGEYTSGASARPAGSEPLTQSAGKSAAARKHPSAGLISGSA